MAAFENPALKRFVAQLGDGLLLAQVLIRRTGSGTYTLRHVADEARAEESLRLIQPTEARALAQSTEAGAFRPLKSAPNLQTGWRMAVANAAELETVLNQLYPGAIADWYAAEQANPPVTHFREFTERQSGMYRITAMLSDAQAAPVIRAGCAKQFCLKRRLWTVAGLSPDGAGEKSLIPCLEPCAILMEFARKAMRIEQAEKIRLELAPDEAETLQAALTIVLAQPQGAVREGDVSAAENPRRLQLVLEKLEPVLRLAGKSESE
jgi:hypothetical protein